MLHHLPARREQAEARDHDVGATRERLEHPLRPRGVARLSEHDAVQQDLRVDAEHRPLPARRAHRAGLLARVRPDELDRVGRRPALLHVARRLDLERDPQLLEDRPPLGRGRGEQQRRGGRRAHRFRATQISSAGHLRPHADVTKA